MFGVAVEADGDYAFVGEAGRFPDFDFELRWEGSEEGKSIVRCHDDIL